MNAFVIGQPTSDFLTVSVLNRPCGNESGPEDANWLNVEIAVAAGPFRGKYPAYLRCEDFVGFKSDLGKLYQSLQGAAEFSPMEEQLLISIEGDGIGHIMARCTARDEAGIGNTLEFTLTFDQTEIPRIVRELDTIISTYPPV